MKQKKNFLKCCQVIKNHLFSPTMRRESGLMSFRRKVVWSIVISRWRKQHWARSHHRPATWLSSLIPITIRLLINSFTCWRIVGERARWQWKHEYFLMLNCPAIRHVRDNVESLSHLSRIYLLCWDVKLSRILTIHCLINNFYQHEISLVEFSSSNSSLARVWCCMLVCKRAREGREVSSQSKNFRVEIYS